MKTKPTPTTLEEAREQRLDIFYLMTPLLAEHRTTMLTTLGRKVVAVFEETLPGASRPMWIVCVERQKQVAGPQGHDRKKGKNGKE